MSGPDVKLPEGERQKLLDEVREYLPAFLHRESTEQHDPVGDVSELLNLEREDLDRVVAVHQCLAPAVLELGAALRNGLRRPLSRSVRAPEVSQTVRGSVDWGRTTGRRALAAGDPTVYVVRSAGRALDTPENQALAWILKRLASMVDAAITWERPSTAVAAATSWSRKLETLRRQIGNARRVEWLRPVEPKPPTTACLQSLRASRDAFYVGRVLPALESVLRLNDPSPETLTEALAERYFVPNKNSQLFEVVVALRLARAFAESSPGPRKSRLLVGARRSSFARYALDDGSEITLMYQVWPRAKEPTMRQMLGQRHGLGSHKARPDIVVERTEPEADAVVLELKASYDPAYLRRGLAELLGYLADRPDLWPKQPAGWLVAPASDAFRDAAADPESPLWIVSADAVAAAAVRRFLTG